ncbi:VOC family protein [Variovorax sp. dw_308]|uniref:VOC family protein n=1 Tax=Variovorax sp. dw_308 TaxID=2721546 RepID=UPI001C48D75E|nr:VOC family protein [Variovorax sp. dw_308]
MRPAGTTALLDHLVIAARTLDEGVQWCEATLGVTPGPGGVHSLMGTHNRLLNVASLAFPLAYLEIIAIDPERRPARTGKLHRWFDLDDPMLQLALARGGPQLVHLVARVSNAAAAVHALAHMATHIDRGHLIEASRDTAAGRLDWRITVRDDGQRLFYGALPTLIQWGPVHPIDTMPASGLQLLGLAASHPRVDSLRSALEAIGFDAMTLKQGPPNLTATLTTPRGVVTLESKGH